MKELGEYSVPLHRQIGELVKSLQLDHLFILADPDEATALAQGAVPVPTEQFLNHTELEARLKDIMQPGDRILFKASRAVELDKVVAKFTKTSRNS